jgi:hypothetical protein
MQHLGLLTFLLIIVGLTVTVTKWRGGLHMTLSQRAATNRSSKIFYSLIFMATLPLLMFFFAAWLVPTKNLPNEFLWFATVAIVFQIACTWVPEEGGRKTIVHRILTSISGIALIPLIVIIASAPNLSTEIRNTAWVMLLIMIALLGIALSNQKGYRYALLLQIGYYLAFFIVILMITYL